ARAAGPPRLPHLRRREVRFGTHLRPGRRPARAVLDVPAPGALRAGDGAGGVAAAVARPVRVPAEGGPGVRAGVLTRIRRLIEEDVGGRGLATVPGDNLLTARPRDFSRACRTLARKKPPAVGVVTGFYIPHAEPPAAETDGPLGALFLARALVPHGIRVVL